MILFWVVGVANPASWIHPIKAQVNLIIIFAQILYMALFKFLIWKSGPNYYNALCNDKYLLAICKPEQNCTYIECFGQTETLLKMVNDTSDTCELEKNWKYREEYEDLWFFSI